MWYKTDLMVQILKSFTAKKMVDYVSKIYGESYYGLWLFQIMGVEIDEVKQFAEGLYDEIFIQTATWTLLYWENAFGIVSDPNMSDKQRREQLISTVKKQAMNPWNMKTSIESLSGCKTEIIEHTGKNRFSVNVYGTVTNTDEITDLINKLKPAHLLYDIVYILENNGKLKIGACSVTNETMEIWPELTKELSITEETNCSGIVLDQYILEIYPE